MAVDVVVDVDVSEVVVKVVEWIGEQDLGLLVSVEDGIWFLDSLAGSETDLELVDELSARERLGFVINEDLFNNWEHSGLSITPLFRIESTVWNVDCHMSCIQLALFVSKKFRE